MFVAALSTNIAIAAVKWTSQDADNLHPVPVIALQAPQWLIVAFATLFAYGVTDMLLSNTAVGAEPRSVVIRLCQTFHSVGLHPLGYNRRCLKKGRRLNL